MPDKIDIAVVGAGAAGLAAAIFAAEALHGSVGQGAPRVVVLDGAKTIGAKILISGGGRCNVTHAVVRSQDFHGSQPVIRNVMAAFSEQATCRWFASLGVELRQEETGKLFPVTDKARTVLDALLRRCRELHVALLPQHRVMDIQSNHAQSVSAEPCFVMAHSHGTLLARRMILATGGRSLPKTGSDGGGWDIVRRLGHTVTETSPALVPLVLESSMFHAELSGLSHTVELTTLVEGKVIDRRTGSLLWTHFGVSGPVVMDSSRFWTMARVADLSVDVRCNFCPGQDFSRTNQWLLERGAENPQQSIAKTLSQRFPERFATALCRWCGLDPVQSIAQLPQGQRRSLVHGLTGCRLPVLRDRGWNYAEVTAGGVPLSEIDFRSMASRKVPGLYVIGEMLDCDGRIGGFNFQWAWATGHAAGRAAAASLDLEE
ncbi:MAG TPA: aminoacetone oxidase family FAD-binding enzyme [Nitrospiraceae bacterium]|nr:aminoacetone oxidase family FAD-binding enzyme [Nitrospiraceae bacterium]